MRSAHLSLSLAWLLIVGVVWGSADAAEAPESPNVLFIAVDDMNDWIEPLGGHPQAITPNLDRLASMGVTFTNAHTAASACHPSRIAIMTGVRPSESGLTTNDFSLPPGPTWRERYESLEDAVPLSQHFRDHGYRAVGGGKIYHALQWWPGSKNDPDTWDAYYPKPHKPIPDWPRPPESVFERQNERWFGERPLGGPYFNWTPIHVPDEQTGDYKVVEWAVDQLHREHEKPFFIACGIFRPHIPWEVPQKYFEMYPLDEVKLPKHKKDDLIDAWIHDRRPWHQFVRQNEQWRSAVRGYLASITYADAMIGRLLDGLRESGHRDDTIVVLWSDHGMHIGEKENWEKFTVWEESTRVPLFVVAPGVTEPGTRCDTPVTLLDVYPTLAELAGTDPPAKQLDGESLVPLLRDPQNGRNVQPAITSHGRNHSVRTERWRYIFNHDGSGLEELYDHRNDPGEHTNLAYMPEHLDTLKRHRALLRRFTSLDPPSGRPSLPAGFKQLANGRVRRVDYTRMDEAVERAIEAHKAGERIPVIGGDGGKNRVRDKMRFVFDALESRGRSSSPWVAGRALRITAEIVPEKPDGTILAQGAGVLGYAVYLKDGRLTFTVRINREATTIAGGPVPEGPFRIEARLAEGGAMSLAIDGEQVAAGKAPGLIPRQPRDPLSTAYDQGAATGEYGGSHDFDGEIRELTLRLGEPTEQ